MSLLRKILLIAVIGLCAGNVEGAFSSARPVPAPPSATAAAPHPATTTVFDLPSNTPGLRIGNTQNKIVNGIPDKECIHVIVPDTPAAKARGVATAMQLAGNIYFPADGRQPTTPEAVEYACANIDNREDSPITEWYMQMFGVIPYKGDGATDDNYIKAGWNSEPFIRQKIVRFSASIDTVNVIHDSSFADDLSRREFFIRIFRKIASTSVGRTLLYRILIEINRPTSQIKAGRTQGTAVLPLMEERNNCRSIEIRWGIFSFFSSTSCISVNNDTPLLTVLGASRAGYDDIIPKKTLSDVALFHEMLHWYHHLRDVARQIRESNRGPSALHFTDVPIGQFYWRKMNSAKLFANMVVSESVWSMNLPQLGSRVLFEDIRTILGVPNNFKPYLEGDDLSENLYRMCTANPLRFGYGNSSFYEDHTVIDKVIESVTSHKNFYNPIGRTTGKVNFSFTNDANQQGIGNFRKFP
ncbi:MAG: hypothetical protein K6C34_01455 [Alphaproteobacteria bacterium]|nr:hypothetical protein [Alphaproteobacteria bacterium]